MMTALLGFGSILGAVVGLLLWRLRQDRRIERAQAVRAQVGAALFRAFGGESLVAVRVDPPGALGPGRVVLRAPADWHALLARHLGTVLAEVPRGYELVVTPVAPAASAPPAEELALPRAA